MDKPRQKKQIIKSLDEMPDFASFEMAKDTVVDAIKFLEQCLIEKRLNISKVILFGSQAEGRATDESDVDILIISDDFQGKDIFERAELTKEAEIMTIKKFLIPFDIITLTSDELENGNSLVAEHVKTRS